VNASNLAETTCQHPEHHALEEESASDCPLYAMIQTAQELAFRWPQTTSSAIRKPSIVRETVNAAKLAETTIVLCSGSQVP
jgi:hypothetical protein